MENEFRKWIDNIPTGDYLNVRTKIIDKCCITPNIFKHWRAGITPVPFANKQQLNRMFKVKIFEL